MRICIAGGPNSGKTTLALSGEFDGDTIHTDDYMHLGWSAASASLALRLLELSESVFVMEGVAVIRALRKALELDPGKPCDKLIILGDWPTQPPADPMTKGMRTVFAEIHVELMRRGVDIEYR